MNKKDLNNRTKFIKNSTKQRITLAVCVFILLCLTAAIIISGTANKSAINNTGSHLSGMENELTEITKYLESLEDAVVESQKLINSVHKESDDNHDMMLEKVSQIDNIITSLMQNHEELAINIKIDDAVIKSQLLKSMQTIEEAKNELYLLLESDFQDARNALDGKVILLNSLLDDLSAQISVTKREIRDLFADLNEALENGNNAITETMLFSFNEVKEGLEFINESHIFLLNEVNELHSFAMDSENKKHSELLDFLNQMKQSISGGDEATSLSTVIKHVELLSDNSYENFLTLLTRISTDYNNMLSEFNDLHSSSMHTENSNHAYLIDILTQMELRFNRESSESLSLTINNIEQLGDSSYDNFLTLLNQINSNHNNMLSEIEHFQQNAMNIENSNHATTLTIIEQMELRLTNESASSLLAVISQIENFNENNYENFLNFLNKASDDYDRMLLEINHLQSLSTFTAISNQTKLIDVLEQMEIRLNNDNLLSLSTLIDRIDLYNSEASKFFLDYHTQISNDYDLMVEKFIDFHNITVTKLNSDNAELIDILTQIASESKDDNALIATTTNAARDNINLNISGINNKLGDFGADSNLALYFHNRFISISNHVDDVSGQVSDIANDIDDMNSKIDSLFTSVSSAKKALAAALLTDSEAVERNVSSIPSTETGRVELPFLDYANIITNHDNVIKEGKLLLANALIANNKIIVSGINSQSSFNAFKTAIDNAICANLNCGAAPNVIYTHHYHTISGEAGTTLLNDNLDNTMRDSSGGCYQAAVPHAHQGNTLSGGSCYGTVSHSHVASCYVAYVHGGNQYTCPFDGNVYRDWAVPSNACHFGYPFNANGSYCANCGQFSANHQFGGSRCYTLTCSVHPFSLSCGRTVDGYKTNCGRMRGEIISATIMY